MEDSGGLLACLLGSERRRLPSSEGFLDHSLLSKALQKFDILQILRFWQGQLCSSGAARFTAKLGGARDLRPLTF